MLAGTVAADPTLPAVGDTATIKYNNWEQFQNDLVDGNGNFQLPGPATGLANGTQDLRGIARITTIQDGSGIPTHVLGQNGEFLIGVFYGLDLDSVTTDGAGGFNLGLVGGHIDIYILPANLNPFATGVGAWASDMTYDGINGAGDANPLYLSLDFDPGVDNAGTTLQASIDGTTVPATGDGTAFLSVATTPNGTGTGNIFFDNDGIFSAFPSFVHDASFQNDFSTPSDSNDDGVDDSTGFNCAAGTSGLPGVTANPCFLFAGGWHLVSEDPVRSFVVPEPGSLAIFGAGLAGLGFIRRRTRKEAETQA